MVASELFVIKKYFSIYAEEQLAIWIEGFSVKTKLTHKNHILIIFNNIKVPISQK